MYFSQTLNALLFVNIISRWILGIHGLLPPKVRSQKDQVDNCLRNCKFYIFCYYKWIVVLVYKIFSGYVRKYKNKVKNNIFFENFAHLSRKLGISKEKKCKIYFFKKSLPYFYMYVYALSKKNFKNMKWIQV